MKKNTVQKDLPLGLYIHIPFCRSKCAYCDFYSLAGAEARMDDLKSKPPLSFTESAPRKTPKLHLSGTVCSP